jgi:hypothetical protein
LKVTPSEVGPRTARKKWVLLGAPLVSAAGEDPEGVKLIVAVVLLPGLTLSVLQFSSRSTKQPLRS